MRKFFIILAFAVMGNFVFVSNVSAQYNTGIGLRLGSANGITVKHFVGDYAAIEAIVHRRWQGTVLTGLFEVHNNIQSVRGLDWFYGGGAHVGTWNAGNHNTPWGQKNESYTIFGISGIIGLDYKFYNSPFNLSLDWKPSYNFSNVTRLWEDEVALSVRFAF